MWGIQLSQNGLYRTAVSVVIVGLLYVLAYQYTTSSTQRIVTEIDRAMVLAERDIRLTVVADMIESPYDLLYTSCPSSGDQLEFDRLLGRLGSGLSPAELQFLSIQFTDCAGELARRQAIRAAAVAEAVQRLRGVLAVRSELLPDESGVSMSDWEQLVIAERDLALAHQRLVNAQRDLLTARANGQSLDSETIQTTLAHVPDMQAAIQAAHADRQELYDKLNI